MGLLDFFKKKSSGDIAKDRLKIKAKYVVLILGFVLVGVNASFIMFNNTIPGAATEEFFSGNKKSDASAELIFSPSLPGGGQSRARSLFYYIGVIL